MSRWITDEKGLWHPGKEKVSLTNNSDKPIINPSATWSNYYGQVVQPKEPYIYEGPDRAAMFDLFDAKVEHLGHNFFTDVDLIQRARQMGYKDVQEYATIMGYDEKKAKERFAKHGAAVTMHELPKKVAATRILGGGTDFSGQGQDVRGDFGDPPQK